MQLNTVMKNYICCSPCIGSIGQGNCQFHFALIDKAANRYCWYCVWAVSLEFALKTLQNFYAGQDFRYRKLDIDTYKLYISSLQGYDLYLF